MTADDKEEFRKMNDMNYIQTLPEKINQRRRQLLVHSVIYYKFNENIVDDHTWSKWAKELVQLQKERPNVAEKCVYPDLFRDFDGSTGFHLAEAADDWSVEKARYLMDLERRRIV